MLVLKLYQKYTHAVYLEEEYKTSLESTQNPHTFKISKYIIQYLSFSLFNTVFFVATQGDGALNTVVTSGAHWGKKLHRANMMKPGNKMA